MIHNKDGPAGPGVGPGEALYHELDAACADWEVMSGEKYLYSSDLYLNKPVIGPDGGRKWLPDTGHDLRDLDQFVDHMDSRSAQAKALAAELALYKQWSAVAPDDDATAARKAVLECFYVDRAVMALYGHDEAAHADGVSRLESKTGESPYGPCWDDMLEDLMTNGPDGLTKRLEAFSSGWDGIAARESKLSEAWPEPLAVISTKSGSDAWPVYSQDMLNRYVAELKGHECYRDRGMAMDGISPPERERLSIRGDGFDRKAVNRILDLCRTPRAGVHVFDAAELVALATDDGREFEAVKSARKGLDIEAAAIEAGRESAGNDGISR